MAHYPIMLAGKGMLAVVVGGGDVGRRRVEGLLAAGARVRVVEPREVVWPAAAQWQRDSYRPEHLAGARLVFACTNDAALNARIAADGRAAGALVNRADDPADSDFACPAVWRGENLLLAVATAAGSPTVAAAIRDELAAAIPAQADAFAAAVAQLREHVKTVVADAGRQAAVLRQMAGTEGLARFREGGAKALGTWLDNLLR
jgi:precorrin-2 dehydrogenase / sirohydrochlorin ferrochelatase